MGRRGKGLEKEGKRRKIVSVLIMDVEGIGKEREGIAEGRKTGD